MTYQEFRLDIGQQGVTEGKMKSMQQVRKNAEAEIAKCKAAQPLSTPFIVNVTDVSSYDVDADNVDGAIANFLKGEGRLYEHTRTIGTKSRQGTGTA